MFRSSRQLQNDRMQPFISTTEMPAAFNPRSINGLQLWARGGNISGSTWYDSSGQGHHLTLHNTPTVSTVTGYSCLSFDSTNSQYASVPQFLDSSVSYTICTVAQVTNTATFRGLVSQGNSTNPAFSLRVTSSSELSFQVNEDASSSRSLTYTPSVDASTWYFLAGVFDAAAQTSSAYINAVSPGTESSLTSFDTAGNLYVGCQFEAGSTDQYWQGYISDVMVYDRALSGAEISELNVFLGF